MPLQLLKLKKEKSIRRRLVKRRKFDIYGQNLGESLENRDRIRTKLLDSDPHPGFSCLNFSFSFLSLYPP